MIFDKSKRKINDRVKKRIHEISRARGIDISRKSPFSKAERNVTSLSWKKLFSFSRLSLPLLPLSPRKSTARKCFFHRCITPLHGRPISFASLPLEPPTQRQVAFRSFSVFYLRSSLSLSLFFLLFFFSPFLRFEAWAFQQLCRWNVKSFVKIADWVFRPATPIFSCELRICATHLWMKNWKIPSLV